MIPVTILMLLQTAMFCAGSILLIYAGKQDEKTRKPLLIIPALITIGLSAGLTTFIIITLASILMFILPSKVNKLIGKADLLLLASTLTIFILNQNIILSLIVFSSHFTSIILIIFDKNKQKEVPLIHYYSKGYAFTTLLTIILLITYLIGGLI